MTRKPTFPCAYCEKLRRTVKPYELREAVQGDPEPDKEKLRTIYACSCADEGCRKTKNPEISGAGCFTPTKRAPYFKTFPNQSHSETCMWGLFNNVMDKMLLNKAEHRRHSDRALFFDLPDSETLIDVWALNRDEFEADFTDRYIQEMHEARTYEQKIKITENQHHRTRTQTLDFDELIDTFNRLQKGEIATWKEKKVKIAGHWTTYQASFINVAFTRYHAEGERIFFGWAKVTADSHGYRAVFHRPKRENPGLGAISRIIPQGIRIILSMPYSSLADSPDGERIEKQFKKAVQHNGVTDLYIFGSLHAEMFFTEHDEVDWVLSIVPVSLAGMTTRDVR